MPSDCHVLFLFTHLIDVYVVLIVIAMKLKVNIFVCFKKLSTLITPYSAEELFMSIHQHQPTLTSVY